MYSLHPQPPRLDLDSNGQMILDLLIELRIRCKQLLDRTILTAPALVRVVPCLAREEAVVGEEFTAVARAQNDLVPLAFLTTPVLERRVLRVVDKSQALGVFGQHVGVQAGGVCRASLWRDADEFADGGTDTIGTDNQVVVGFVPIGERDVAGRNVEVFALCLQVSLPSELVVKNVSGRIYLVVNQQLHRLTIPLLL